MNMPKPMNTTKYQTKKHDQTKKRDQINAQYPNQETWPH